MDIAKTMAEGGKEVVGALDKRIATSPTSSTCAAPSSPKSSAPRSTTSTRRSACTRWKSPNNLDTRIGRFEELLIGRAEAVTKEIETRSKSAADMLGARTEHLSGTIKTQRGEAAQAHRAG